MCPLLFKDTPYAVETWELMMLIGFIVVLMLAIKMRPKDFPVSKSGFVWWMIFLTVIGILAGKFFGIYIRRHAFFGIMHVSFGTAFLAAGTDIYGAFTAEILGILAGAKLRRKRLSFFTLADYFMPFIIFDQAFARIGCFLRGCCYGTPTNLPWGRYFEEGDVLRHPVQLYETIYVTVIFFAMITLYRKNPAKGTVFFSTVGLYGVLRFISDFLRDETTRAAGGLTYQQCASLIAVAVAVTGLLIIKGKNKLESLKKG